MHRYKINLYITLPVNGSFFEPWGNREFPAAGSMTFSPFGVGLALMKVAISCYVAVLNSAALQQAGCEKNTGRFVWVI